MVQLKTTEHAIKQLESACSLLTPDSRLMRGAYTLSFDTLTALLDDYRAMQRGIRSIETVLDDLDTDEDAVVRVVSRQVRNALRPEA